MPLDSPKYNLDITTNDKTFKKYILNSLILTLTSIDIVLFNEAKIEMLQRSPLNFGAVFFKRQTLGMMVRNCGIFRVGH